MADRPIKRETLEMHSVKLKEVVTGNFRPATDEEIRAFDVDGLFIQRYSSGKFIESGYISYFKDPKHVLTYRCKEIIIGNAGRIYVTGDLLPMRLKQSGNKSLYIVQTREGWTLQELVLIPYLMCKFGIHSVEYQSYLYWANNSGMRVQINHKNGNLRTRSVYDLEVCSKSENANHQEKMGEIREHVDELIEKCNLSKNFWEWHFVGFSAKAPLNMTILNKALKVSLEKKDPSYYANTGRDMGIFA